MRIEDELCDIHVRLSGVCIENLPNEKILARYDKPHTFFYLDPPYWGREGDYGRGIFARKDFGKLRDLLGGIYGKFIMPINRVREIRDLFGKFRIASVSTVYTAPKKGEKKRGKELLISNF